MGRHILIEIESLGPAYQETDGFGNVARYLDIDGQPLFDAVPTGLGSRVIDAEPKRKAWMDAADAALAAAACSCGASCLPEWKFCAECGATRV